MRLKKNKNLFRSATFILGSAIAFASCGEIPGLTEEDDGEGSDISSFSSEQSESDFNAPSDVPEIATADLPNAMDDLVRELFSEDGGGDDGGDGESATLALVEESSDGGSDGSSDGGEGGGDDGFDPFDCMQDLTLTGSDGELSLKGHVNAASCLNEQFNSDPNSSEQFNISDAVIRFSIKLTCDADFSSYNGQTLGTAMAGEDPLDSCTGTTYGFYEQMSMQLKGTMTHSDGSENIEVGFIMARNNGFNEPCNWTVTDTTESLSGSCTFISGERVLIDGELPSPEEGDGDGPKNRFFKATSSDIESTEGYEYYTGGSAVLQVSNWDANIEFSTTSLDWTAGDQSGSIANNNSASALRLRSNKSGIFAKGKYQFGIK